MSTNVVTVSPELSLKEVAALLAKHRISGVPVCGPGGDVVGVVTEGDILWKERGLRTGHGTLEWILERAYGEEERISAQTAGEAMTSPPLTIAPDASLPQAAELMIRRNVNRLPVLEGGRLVGIVARADLVRAFTRSDEEIEREISNEVLREMLWIDPDSVSLVVTGGKVSVVGEVENRSTAESIESRIRAVPGVVGVRSKLRWQIDDRSRKTEAAADHLARPV